MMTMPRDLAARPLLAALALALLAGLPRPAAAQELHRSDLDRLDLSPKVRQLLERDPEALQFQRAWKPRLRHVLERRAQLEAMNGMPLMASDLRQAGAAVTGELEIPVALGLYSGATQPFTPADYQERLFGDVPGSYSVRTVYREMSRGAFEMGGTAHGWYNLPQPASYYEPSDTTDATFGRAGEYIRDVLDVMDATVDFTQYDNDGPDGIPNSSDDDGYVDVVTFVYPTWAASCGGPGIWPHRWVYRGWWGAAYATNDAGFDGTPIRVDDYTVQAGVSCDESSLMTIGTFSHEMGHALGLPDLYDTDDSNGESEGIGHWGLMGSGNWNRQPSPAHMGAWSKETLGWLNVSTITGGQDGTVLPPVYDNGDVLRYDIAGTREYYLLEHREPVGSDQYLHGPGLLVWHIDQDVIDDGVFTNGVNGDATRKGVDVEEADGLDELDFPSSEDGNRGDAGDPFPGTSGNTAFATYGYPDSRANDGAPSGLVIENIALVSGTLSFDILPGLLFPGLATDADSLVRAAAQPIRLELYLQEYPETPGSASGSLLVDTDVLWVDSITAGSFGGSVTADLARQDVDGTVTWSVSNPAPPAADTVALLEVWVSAVTEGGATGAIEASFSGLTDQGDADILSHLRGEASLSPTAATGIWGDVDYSWRLDPDAFPVAARDALVCLNQVVGKDMSAFDTPACDVVADAGAGFDGTITAADALALLKAVVGLDTSDSRTAAPRTP